MGGSPARAIKRVISPPSPPPAPAPAPAPTTAEVSQVTTTDAYDPRDTKRKGRSMTILTGPKGVRQDETITLGYKSLLGK
jgi:hypothetical protein